MSGVARGTDDTGKGPEAGGAAAQPALGMRPDI